MLDNVNLAGEKVLVRVDFNVPLNSNFEVTDDTRIKGALSTILNLLDRGATVILMSHLGRPLKDLDDQGNMKTKYSLKHIVQNLSDALNYPVLFLDQPIGSNELETALDQLGSYRVVLLENTRKYKGEEKGDVELAKSMASIASYYINDAFGAAHREHASTATIARFYDREHKDYGFLMNKEVQNISSVITDAKKPFCAIIGGAKVSDKITLIERLLEKVDTLIIGGGMAFTFIKAQGGKIGKSLVENDKLEMALDVLRKAADRNIKLLLPVDVKCGEQFSNETPIKDFEIDNIPDGWSGFDIGQKSIKIFEDAIITCNTILWNGPMGVFEFSNFANGTLAIAKTLEKATEKGAYTIVGGGDSVAAISQAGLDDKVSFVSTGGGAMLEMLEGKDLPGVTAIKS